MIEVRGVSKSYGRVRAVRDVSFEIPPGLVTGLLGPNGAGKTSTIRMVTGWVPPDAGTIRVGGHAIPGEARLARALLGYLPESGPSYQEMRTSDYLDLRARMYRLERKARRERLGFVLDRCRLGEVRGRRIAHLSKGYRQRVALAASIIHDPKVLVLDEPTNALDPSQIREVRGLIRDLARDRAVLVSSHILSEVEAGCDRVIIMVRGRVRAQGAPRELAGTRCVVECAAGPDAVGAMLRGVEGIRVEGVEAIDGGSRARVSPQGSGAAARERVARAALAAGIVVRELRDESASLESVFLGLLEAEEPA